MDPPRPKSDLPQSDDSSSSSGSVMEFTLDVIEDVASRVEDMMRLCALGHFREARQQSADLLDRRSDVFPVKVECMRLLLEQGDYQGLYDYIFNQFSDDIARIRALGLTWYPQTCPSQTKPGLLRDVIISQMLDIASAGLGLSEALIEVKSGFSSQSRSPWVSSTKRMQYDSLECLALVLDLKMRYIKNMLWSSIALDLDISSSVTRFLSEDQAWGATNALTYYSHELASIHAVIAQQIILFDLQRSDESQGAESVRFAKINLIQAFLEGSLNSKEPDVARSHVTSQEFRRISQSAMNIEQVSILSMGSEMWKSTRMRIRRELLKLDLAFADFLTVEKVWNEHELYLNSTIRSLEDLHDAALANEDVRCARGCAWRLSVLHRERIGNDRRSVSHILVEDFVPIHLYASEYCASPSGVTLPETTIERLEHDDSETSARDQESISFSVAAETSPSSVETLDLVDEVTTYLDKLDIDRSGVSDEDGRYSIQFEVLKLAYYRWLNAAHIVKPLSTPVIDEKSLDFTRQYGEASVMRHFRDLKAVFEDTEKAAKFYSIESDEELRIFAMHSRGTRFSRLKTRMEEAVARRQPENITGSKARWIALDDKTIPTLLQTLSKIMRNLMKDFSAVTRSLRVLASEDVLIIAAGDEAILESLKSIALDVDPVLQQQLDPEFKPDDPIPEKRNQKGSFMEPPPQRPRHGLLKSSGLLKTKKASLFDSPPQIDAVTRERDLDKQRRLAIRDKPKVEDAPLGEKQLKTSERWGDHWN